MGVEFKRLAQGHMASQLVVSLEPKCFDSKPNAFSSQPMALEMLCLLSFFCLVYLSACL